MYKMKEIKFRFVGLKRSDSEIFIEDNLTVKKIQNGEVLALWRLGYIKLISEDLFTSRKDRNGEDIYEHDIIEIVGHKKDGLGEDILHLVSFDTDLCGFILTPFIRGSENQPLVGIDNSSQTFDYLEGEEFYINIGNIYENPKLLDKNKEFYSE